MSRTGSRPNRAGAPAAGSAYGCRRLNWPHCGTWEFESTSQQLNSRDRSCRTNRDVVSPARGGREGPEGRVLDHRASLPRLTATSHARVGRIARPAPARDHHASRTTSHLPPWRAIDSEERSGPNARRTTARPNPATLHCPSRSGPPRPLHVVRRSLPQITILDGVPSSVSVNSLAFSRRVRPARGRPGVVLRRSLGGVVARRRRPARC